MGLEGSWEAVETLLRNLNLSKKQWGAMEEPEAEQSWSALKDQD